MHLNILGMHHSNYVPYAYAISRVREARTEVQEG
jgi:hypothetical protein